MSASPLNYIDLRDLAGNLYNVSGTGVRVVKYVPILEGEHAGEFAQGDLSDGVNLAISPNNEMYVADLAYSGFYDIYVHTVTGYELVMEHVWLEGQDVDGEGLFRKPFRVGAGDRPLVVANGRQSVAFNVYNYEDSITIFSSGDDVVVNGHEMDHDTGMLVVDITPTITAQERTFAHLVFTKGSTGESSRVGVYMI